MSATTTRRKVLFVVNDARFFVTHRLVLAKGIREAGYGVEVAVPTRGYETAVPVIERAGFRVHPVSINRQGVNPLHDIAVFAQLTALYRRVAPDIVHHVTVKPILYGSIAARLTSVPIIVNAVSGRGRLFGTTTITERCRAAIVRVFYRLAFPRDRAFAIFQNEDDREQFVAANIVNADASAVIRGSGTELGRFNPLRPPDDPPLVLMPARILKQKGAREFIAAARMLAAEQIAARFAIVGDTAGNRDAIPDRDLKKIETEGIIELWGWSDDMPDAMGRAAIICLPSYHEGLPKALLDGCAAGRALVATDIPGCREVVRPGINGFLVPPRNAAALASALRVLIKDPELRAKMGAQSRFLAETTFDVAMTISDTLKLYSRWAERQDNEVGNR